MFGRSYFGGRYFGPRYFGVGSGYTMTINVTTATTTVTLTKNANKQVLMSVTSTTALARASAKAIAVAVGTTVDLIRGFSVNAHIWVLTNLDVVRQTAVAVFEFGLRVFRSSRQDRTITSQKDPFRDQ